jgi:hypothetical protein
MLFPDSLFAQVLRAKYFLEERLVLMIGLYILQSPVHLEPLEDRNNSLHTIVSKRVIWPILVIRKS